MKRGPCPLGDIQYTSDALDAFRTFSKIVPFSIYTRLDNIKICTDIFFNTKREIINKMFMIIRENCENSHSISLLLKYERYNLFIIVENTIIQFLDDHLFTSRIGKIIC